MFDLKCFIDSGVLKSHQGVASLSVTGVELDSRKIAKGNLFIAVSGHQQDGVSYIGSAVDNGAIAVVVQAEQATFVEKQYPDLNVFFAEAPREFASLIASKMYENIPENLIAVTGTNGKTSIVSFLRQLWSKIGYCAASVGTLGTQLGDDDSFDSLKSHLTTPDAIAVWKNLNSLAKESVTHVALEASSHGIHQGRLDRVPFKAAIFTNFSNDHLDYHKTVEAYFEAKERLFKELMAPKSLAILNADMPEFKRLSALCHERGIRIISFGEHDGSEVRLLSHVPSYEGQDVMMEIAGVTYNLSLPLVGKFQILNVMASICVLISEGESPERIMCSAASLRDVPGRLNKIIPGFYVDYAHTPDALKTALEALRPHTPGRLRVVFGCGGERDAIKRPMMGNVAKQYADVVYVTDDNPRNEDPSHIRSQILHACPGAYDVPGREQAIQKAMRDCGEGDVLLVAGKGHEGYQLIGDISEPFSDTEVILRLSKELI